MSTIPYSYDSTPSPREGFSSEKLREKALESQQVLDGTLTPGRLVRCSSNDISKNYSHDDPHTQGTVIDWTSHHHFVTGFIILVMMGLTGLAWLYYWREEQEKFEIQKYQYESTHAKVKEKLLPALTPEHVQSPPPLSRLNEKELNYLNKCLETVLQGPQKNQFQRFANATLNQNEKGQIELKFTPGFNFTSLLLTTWNMLFYMSFVYWLGWILMGTALGTFGIGFAGCSKLVSFGISILPGLSYIGIKVKHWYEYQQAGAPATLEDLVNADKLMECVGFLKKNGKQLEAPSPPLPLTLHGQLRIAAAFLIGAVAAFGGAHYILWFLSGMIPVLAQGGLLDFFSMSAFVVAGIFGVRQGLVKHTEIVNTPSSSMSYQTLQTEYDEVVRELNEKKKILRGEETLSIFLGRVVGEALKSPYYLFYDYFMSAAFVARVFTLMSTSEFLPSFFHMATAVATLSPLAVFWIIAGVGVTWAIFRTYVRRVEEKAALQKKYDLAYEELKTVEKMIEEKSPQLVVTSVKDSEKSLVSNSRKGSIQYEDTGVQLESAALNSSLAFGYGGINYRSKKKPLDKPKSEPANFACCRAQ